MFFVDRNITAIYNLSKRPQTLPAAWEENPKRAEGLWQSLLPDSYDKPLRFVHNPRYMRGAEGLAGITDGETIWWVPEAFIIWAEDSPDVTDVMQWYVAPFCRFLIGTDGDNNPICAIRPLFAERISELNQN